MVICLGRGADLHVAQLMPLPLTISCSNKSRLVLLFWYRLTQVVPDKGPLNGCCCCCCCNYSPFPHLVSNTTNAWLMAMYHIRTPCWFYTKKEWRSSIRYQPICLIFPLSTTIIKSAACRKCTWWVTRMRVVCCNKPTMHSVYKCLATWTSTAARGSSSKYTSFSCNCCCHT